MNKDKIKIDKNYNNLKINYNSPDNIEIISQIYFGKYSDVFEGLDIINKKIIIIKAFKKTHIRKIKKEIFIIETLKNENNIISINKVIKDPYSNTISLIFDKFFHTKSNELKYLMNKNLFQSYFKELCLSIKSCHSKNIIHRDIRTDNFLFNLKNSKGKLIDFGSSCFYKKDISLKPFVGNKYYMAPEKLLGSSNYNESSDIWSLGCVLAEFIGNVHILFYSNTIHEQINLMLEIIGYEKFNLLISNYKLNNNIVDLKKITENKYNKGNWFSHSHLYSKEAFSLLQKMLSFNPKSRPTINEILENNFFKINFN